MARACETCHARKVRCDLPSIGEAESRCSNCANNGIECRPHLRKRKRLSEATPRGADVPPPQFRAAEPSHVAGTAAHRAPQPAPAIPTPSSTLSEPQSGIQSSFLGRSGYITSNDLAIDEEDAMRYEASPSSTAGDSFHLQSSMLRTASTIRLPPPSLRLSLINSFVERGSMWMPIVDRSEIERLASQSPTSPLLTAVLVAGSKVSAAPNALEYGEKCYFYTKSHFFLGSGASILRLLTITILLNWWNPAGPEHVSLDSSSLWLRIGVGLAHQLGLHRQPDPALPDARLRRRIWWTLVTRDNQIATSHGRPRALRPEDSNVKPLQLSDFDSGNEFDALIFIHFVRIVCILGDITEHYRCGSLSERHRLNIEIDLVRWVNELPQALSLHDQTSRALKPYNPKLRQLHVPFFVALIIFYRSDTPGQQFSLASLLAASFVSGIFEEYVAWGDIMFLAPASIFYLLVSSLIQVSSYQYLELGQNIEAEVANVRVSLKELRKRFPTAYGAERIFEDLLRKSRGRGAASQNFVMTLSSTQKELFAHFGPDLCVSWSLAFPNTFERTSSLDQFQTGEQPSALHPARAVFTNSLAGIHSDPNADPGLGLAQEPLPLMQPADNIGDFTFGGFDFWWPDWTETNR